MTYECIVLTWKLTSTHDVPKLEAFLQGAVRHLGEEVFEDTEGRPGKRDKEGIFQRLASRKAGRTGPTLYETSADVIPRVSDSPDQVAQDALSFWNAQHRQPATDA